MQVPGKYVVAIFNRTHTLLHLAEDARRCDDVDKLAIIAEEVMKEARQFKADADRARALARHDDTLNRGSHLRV